MIYLFLNCHEYLASQRIAELKAALGDAEMADLNTTELAGTQASASELLGHAAMMPFLTPRRIVLLRGYLSHLDKRMAASSDVKNPVYGEAAHFLEGMGDVPETCDLVLVEDEIDKRRHLWKGFARRATAKSAARQVAGIDALIKTKQVRLESLAAPDNKALPGWVMQRANSRKTAIENRAVHMLADLVGADLRRLDNELDKLATYAYARTITAGDVELLVSDAREAVVWSLTDALSQRNARNAVSALHLLRRGDMSPFYLLTMIARQYRLMIKVKEATQRQGGSEYDIAASVGESPFPVKKAMQQSGKYSFEQLEAVLDRLLEADFAMKTGADPDTEMDILVAELAQKEMRNP